MNRIFTLNEDIIRRLVLRRERDEREHERSRHGYVSLHFWRGLSGLVHESPWFASRAR